MKIEHNSREAFYRSPFGAACCGSEVTLHLAISEGGIPSSVQLVIKEDDSQEQSLDMAYIFEVNGSSIYSVSLTMPYAPNLMWYYFKIVADNKTVYYGNNTRQLGGLGECYSNIPEHCFQITVYEENYKTPDWFKEGVAYQIFPDRFCNGNDDGSFLGNRDDIIKRNWNETPFYKAEQFGGEYKANDFFGGNLKGIIKKLPYLKELGISVIYLNPIFRAYSNHKYDTGSYEEIDPMFGDEKTFKELCAKAKEMGIRIILDGVFNHTGSDSMYFNKKGTYDSTGAYQSQNSPYYTWFRFYDWPEKYESWWGIDTLPQIEENSKELQSYLLCDKNSIIKKWLRLGASGWRLDVVDELPGFFVKELRKNAKAEKEDAVIIGEVWEDASNKIAYGERRQYFMGKELDSVMNYPMRDALIAALLGHIDAAALNERLMSLKENYPAPAYYSLLNMVSGHDVERILTLMSGAPNRHMVDKDTQSAFNLQGEKLLLAKKRALVILCLQMTLPGVPCIFYGDEIGLQGYGDPFCRRTFPWDNMDESDPDKMIRNCYMNMISLRKSSKAFSLGEFEAAYAIGSVYAFVRRYGDEKYIVIANIGNKFEKIRLDAARFAMKSLSLVNGQENHNANDCIFYIDIPEYSVKVFKE